MEQGDSSKQMAQDDIFFAVAIIFIGLYASKLNWNEGDWVGLFGTIVLSLFGGIWLGARIYQLKGLEGRES